MTCHLLFQLTYDYKFDYEMTCHLLFQLTYDYKFDYEDDMSLVISADL